MNNWKEIKLKNYSIQYFHGIYELILHLDEAYFDLYPNEVQFQHHCRNNVVKYLHDYIVYGSVIARKLNKFSDIGLE